MKTKPGAVITILNTIIAVTLLALLPTTVLAATSFELSGYPTTVSMGVPFNITVTAKNADNSTDTAYAGTVYFNNSITSATFPEPYTFVPSDSGSHTFSVTFTASQNQSIQISDSGLEGYWNLDEGSGTTAADSSGNGNTATLYGPPTWSTDVPGTVFANSASLTFSGTTNYISITKPPPLQLATSTITTWIKADTDVSTYRVIMFDKTTTEGFMCYLEEGTGRLWCQLNEFDFVTSSAPLNDNTWHHIALVIDNNTGSTTLYVDSIPNDSTSVFVIQTPASVSLQIGQWLPVGQYPFLGELDELRIYNRALPEAEIATLATGGGLTSVVRGESTVITVGSPARIITQPESKSILSSQSVTLSVSATGDGTLSYQWYQGVSGDTTLPIADATANSFTTPQLYSNISYWVRVTGTYGSPINSSTAVITTAISIGTFSNSTSITTGMPKATPYPSAITVSGVTGTVEIVRVTLTGVSHDYPVDLGLLLVGPQGQKVVLMDKTGGPFDIINAKLVFDDTGSALTTSAIVSGTYRPTDLGLPRTFPAPAPVRPYSSGLSAFNNINPNGTWQLYVRDAVYVDIGSVTSGWQIEFLTKTYALTINVGGTGSGSVLYQEKSAVVNTSYEASVVSGEQVTLVPSIDQFSVFAGWTGVSGCTTGTCQFNMSANTTASATFNFNSANSVLVSPVYFASIASAYTAGTTTSLSTIKLWGTNYSETLLLGLAKTITLKGGYNNTYTTQETGAFSTITGTLRVKTGKIIADRIKVKKSL